MGIPSEMKIQAFVSLKNGLAINDAAARGGQVNAPEHTRIASEFGNPPELMVRVIQSKPGPALIVRTVNSGQ